MVMNPESQAEAWPKIDPRWRWHYRALMRLNGRLLAERDLHRGGILSEGNEEPIDRATDETERNILFSELRMEDDAIAEIEAALERIRRGTYGTCETTGRPISADRLHAIPWTRYCREAAPRGSARP
jgi:RNA polymerase-binding protein DksA